MGNTSFTKKQLLDGFTAIKDLQEAQELYHVKIDSLREEWEGLKEYSSADYHSEDYFKSDYKETLEGAGLTVVAVFGIYVIWIVLALFENVLPGKKKIKLFLFWGEKIKYKIILVVLFHLFITLLIAFALVLLISAGIKAMTWRAKYNKERSAALKETERRRNAAIKRANDAKPQYDEKIHYYRSLLNNVESKLKQLWTELSCPPKYRCRAASVMFCDYLSSGKCEDFQECMMKFDIDAENMKINRRIDLLEADIDEFKNETKGAIAALGRAVNIKMRDLEELMSDTERRMGQDLNNLDYNRRIQNLITSNILDAHDNSDTSNSWLFPD